jgi:hypothetical protein
MFLPRQQGCANDCGGRHGEAPTGGRRIAVAYHTNSRVCQCAPLAFHFCKLVVIVKCCKAI